MDDEARMTFGEHLEDLRRRLILALLGIVVGVVACGIFHKSITREMLRPYQKAWMALHNPPVEQPTPTPPEGQPAEAVPDAGKPAEKVPLTPVQIPGPPAFFIILVKMCLILGIMLASPWVIYQIWQFVAAGLFPNECRMVRIYVPASFILFVGGAAFFFLFLLPVALQFLMSIGTSIEIDGQQLVEVRYLVSNYFSFISWMTLVFGIIFETPLVVMFLARTGIVPFQTLLRSWRWVVLGGFILGALLTPPDYITMIMVAVPLIVLYGLGLVLALLTSRPASRAGELDDDQGTLED